MSPSRGRHLWRFCESRDLPAQSFGGEHRGRVCIRVFIVVSVRTYCGRRRPHRQRGVCGDFVNLLICRLSTNIGLGITYVCS
jgi:hypothetical protein